MIESGTRRAKLCTPTAYPLLPPRLFSSHFHTFWGQSESDRERAKERVRESMWRKRDAEITGVDFARPCQIAENVSHLTCQVPT